MKDLVDIIVFFHDSRETMIWENVSKWDIDKFVFVFSHPNTKQINLISK